MKIALITAIATVILLTGCGTSKDSTTDKNKEVVTSEAAETVNNNTTGSTGNNTGTNTTNTSTSNENGMNEKQEAIKYRLIISFISIGEGTDPEAKAIMDSVVDKWQATSGKTITSSPKAWGREGEVDYCFMLSELSAEDQAKMARDMRVALDGRQLIQIFEFQASMHNR